MNPLIKIQELGQSIWLDYLRRNIIESGGLERLIEEDGLRGVTSNPSIFEKAIAGSHDYDDDIRTLSLEGKEPFQIYEELTVTDIQNAADIFRPVYDRTKGADGFVSLEVSPFLANDTEGSIKQARHLWSVVNRPNLMIKIPATREGVAAIQRCLEEGININITLLFGIPRYREIVEAYLAALEKRAAEGKSLKGISSVASFFLSRIDVLVDPQLEKIKNGGGDNAGLASSLIGEIAIASARTAYKIYKNIFSSERFLKLKEKGALTQRLLWASTSTKNPAYSDVKYVEALIGPQTINTLPLETIHAYRDHGKPQARLEDGVDQAEKKISDLMKFGIDINQVTQKLEKDGIKKFKEPFDKLMDSIKKGMEKAIRGPVDTEILRLGEDAAGRLNVDLTEVKELPLQQILKPLIE
jgi:transaldolase